MASTSRKTAGNTLTPKPPGLQSQGPSLLKKSVIYPAERVNPPPMVQYERTFIMVQGRTRQLPEGRWIRRLDFKRTAFYSCRTNSTRIFIRGKNAVGRIVEKWINVVREGIVSRGLKPFRLTFASAYEVNN